MTKKTIDSIREEGGAPKEVYQETLRHIKEHDSEVNAYIDVYEEGFEGGVDGSLAGVPIAIKNNILVHGRRATAGSKMLEEYIAPYSATVVKRLEDAGAMIVGSTNLDEFGMGSSTEHSAFGPTKNPVDLERVPGGSSGGSAAAVAMGSVPVALGTDTGGSVRLPASFCGIVGLKPTYGAVSRNGLIAMGSSLECAGPLTQTVTDAETIFNIIQGEDDMDSTTYPQGTYEEVLTKEKYTIGVPRNLMKEGVDPDVLRVFDEVLEKLSKEGHDVRDIELPYMESGLAAYYIVMPSEVSSNMARYDGIRFGSHVEGEDLLEDYIKTRSEGFGEEVKRRILLGTYMLSSGFYDAYYRKASYIRTCMRRELEETYKDIDVIMTPTSPVPAFNIGEKQDPLAMYATDLFTVPANLTGVPALSVPGGIVEREGKDLPVGVQFITPHGGEARLFDIGKRFLGE